MCVWSALRATFVAVAPMQWCTFYVSLQSMLDLLRKVPASGLLVTESGIATPADVALMRNNPVHSF